MSKKIAIIIPAYKDTFLENTILSIEKQTSKNFKLYVCDDASPFDIEGIVKRYSHSIDISYIRFSENLGGIDLIAHWNRCIEVVEDEEFIWLFSDDDVMEDNCVEAIDELIATNVLDEFNVLHFNLRFIDKNNNEICECNPFPPIISIAEFYYLLYRGRITARMPEFVFRARTLLDSGGFVNFDLAWRSDNATVMKVGYPNGVFTIQGKNRSVAWRINEHQISSNERLSKRKNDASIDFFNWVSTFFYNRKITNPLNKVLQLKTIVFSVEL